MLLRLAQHRRRAGDSALASSPFFPHTLLPRLNLPPPFNPQPSTRNPQPQARELVAMRGATDLLTVLPHSFGYSLSLAASMLSQKHLPQYICRNIGWLYLLMVG